MDTEILERLARLEAEVKAAFKRIDEQTKISETTHSLALSVERLTNMYKNMSDKLAGVAADVEELKGKPAKRWDAIIAAAISAIVGVAVGYFFR